MCEVNYSTFVFSNPFRQSTFSTMPNVVTGEGPNHKPVGKEERVQVLLVGLSWPGACQLASDNEHLIVVVITTYNQIYDLSKYA